MVKSLLFQVNKSRGNSVINSTEVPGLGERKFRMLGEGYFHFRDYCDVSLVRKPVVVPNLEPRETSTSDTGVVLSLRWPVWIWLNCRYLLPFDGYLE